MRNWNILEAELESLSKVKNPVLIQYRILNLSEKTGVNSEQLKTFLEEYIQYQRRSKILSYWNFRKRINFSKIILLPIRAIQTLFLIAELLLESVALRMSKMDLFKIIEYIGRLTLLFSLSWGLFTFIREAPERIDKAIREEEEQEIQETRLIYEAWQVLNSAVDRPIDGGRSQALNFLNEQHENLDGLNLEGAILKNLELDGSNLSRSNLSSTSFYESDLYGANLSESNLQNSKFDYSSLEFSNLRKADFKDASISNTDLTGANLMGANLEGVKFGENVRLRNALYDKNTIFPKNFDPNVYKMQKIESKTVLNEDYFDFGFHDLKEIDLSYVDFKTSYFDNTELSLANLTKSSLTSLDLYDLNLERTNFHKANLQYSDLSGSYLYRANLNQADLRNSNLAGTNLTGANLANVLLNENTYVTSSIYDNDTFKTMSSSTQEYFINNGAYNIEGDLRNANLPWANLYGVDLSATCLQGINLENAYLFNANLSKTDLSFARLSKAYLFSSLLEYANLREADLEGANLERSSLYSANLRNSNLSKTFLRNSNLFNAVLAGANLSGADLTNAEIEGADFRGVKGLTVKQIKKANNWERAFYDKRLTDRLGLVYVEIHRSLAEERLLSCLEP